MSLKPKVGLVICYDFLWQDEEKSGRTDGVKDRPCAIVIASNVNAQNVHEVVVCPITHSPPRGEETAVELPYKVCKNLGLDDGRMWIKTHEVNMFQWEDGRIPCGVARTPQGDWEYGVIPYDLRKEIGKQIHAHAKQHELKIIRRDEKKKRIEQDKKTP